MNDDKTKTYDIVLIPDSSLFTKAIDLSRQLEHIYSTLFTLNRKTAIPHYSIYMAELDIDGEEIAKKHLQMISSEFKVFELEATRYWQDTGDGMFEVQYQRSIELVRLQEQVINKINSLRKERFLASYPSGDTKEIMEKKLKDNALSIFRTYAYPEVGEYYRPHMTFTRLAENALEEVIDLGKLPKVEVFNGLYSYLGLYVMGKNGTCKEEICKYPLKGN